MRHCPPVIPILALCFMAGPGRSEPELDALLEQVAFRDTIRTRSEAALVDESTALEQARTHARAPSDYGLELRPSISDNDAGLALRIYLPDRWSKKRLREQLTVAARSEQLRVATMEWEDIVSVYRNFCTYRMLNQQLALIEKELRYVEPYLERADRSVELNQLPVSERARLYSSYLALLNDRNELAASLLEVRQQLMLLLGPDTDIDKLSSTAVVSMPSQMEIESLLRIALEKRSDYQRLGSDIRAMQLAEEAARTEDGFHLKYIQPAYRVDYDDGSNGWELSASFILPWGSRNPDIAVYRQQQILSRAAQTQQRHLIEGRLRVLLAISESYYKQVAMQNQRLKPVLNRLNEDLTVLADVPLEQIRDTLSIRKRILDTSLLSVESKYRAEILAIDLTEELGGGQ